MLNGIHGVMLFCSYLYMDCYTRGKALCSLLYIDRSFMLSVLQGVKLYAHCYTWSEASCSYLYMD